MIVEGTKQHLAAASALDGSSNPYAVVGISGCRGWSKDGRPIPCLHGIPLTDRVVFLAFDADVNSNRNVHDAATQLADTLTTEFLAKRVRLRSLRPQREGWSRRHPGRPPAGEPSADPAADAGESGGGSHSWEGAQEEAGQVVDGLLQQRRRKFIATRMWDYLQELHPMAITREVSTEKAMKGAVAVYENGVYRNGESRCFQRSITRALGEKYSSLNYIDLVDGVAQNELAAQGRRIPDRMDQLLVNCQNGLVDVRTGKLLPHDPEVLTLFQVPVSYDPKATCPRSTSHGSRNVSFWTGGSSGRCCLPAGAGSNPNAAAVPLSCMGRSVPGSRPSYAAPVWPWSALQNTQQRHPASAVGRPLRQRQSLRKGAERRSGSVVQGCPRSERT